MNKDTFVEMTVMGGMIAEDRRLLNSCFDEETGEVDADSFMEYCLMKLQLQTTLRIQGLNKQIADAIHELGVIGQWTNLIQVHRSLPDCIKDAVRNESFEEDITNWVDRQNKWDGLAAKQQESALAFVEEQEWKVKNRQS